MIRGSQGGAAQPCGAPNSPKSQNSVICLIPRANGFRKFGQNWAKLGKIGQNWASCPRDGAEGTAHGPGFPLKAGGREAELSWQEAAGAGAPPGHLDKGQDNPRGDTALAAHPVCSHILQQPQGGIRPSRAPGQLRGPGNAAVGKGSPGVTSSFSPPAGNSSPTIYQVGVVLIS